MQVLMIMIAFFAGVLGTFIGGTQVFIIYGLLGLIDFIARTMGIEMTFFETYLLNCMFLPCIIFGGFGFGMAYATKNYEVQPTETNRTLSRLKDVRVLLVAGIAGIFGYLLNQLFIALNLPLDTGALTVLSLGLFGRILFNREQKWNRENFYTLPTDDKKEWIKNILVAFAASLVAGYLVKVTGVVSIGFSLSAISLILCFKYPNFIATHHATMIAGYAVLLSGNVLFAALMGVIAHILNILFGKLFNDACGTYVDPPAFAITTMSLLLFVLQ